ncbi:MAG: hypothetical protein K9N51_03760 [Candidatus Pacebacteria bacterium]|nr:hypothetical protein [Candidatus Paceibacterota bacterium]
MMDNSQSGGTVPHETSNHALRDAVWMLGEDRDGILGWARRQIECWVPKLTGSQARFGDRLGSGLSIVCGTAERNASVKRALEQGVLDMTELGDDDFILEQTILESKPVLMIAGRTVRAAVYGICGLFERLGCTFLISGDRLPPLEPTLEVPVLNEIEHTDSSWRGIWFGGYCFVANAMFSLPDYEAMFDQMIKLKMNRIVFYHFSQEPFIDYTFKGERKLVGDISHPDSGYISYGREFTGSWLVKDLPVGREKFDREKLCPPEFQDIKSSAEALDTAKAFMRKIMVMAREREIGVWT